MFFSPSIYGVMFIGTHGSLDFKKSSSLKEKIPQIERKHLETLWENEQMEVVLCWFLCMPLTFMSLCLYCITVFSSWKI